MFHDHKFKFKKGVNFHIFKSGMEKHQAQVMPNHNYSVLQLLMNDGYDYDNNNDNYINITFSMILNKS